MANYDSPVETIAVYELQTAGVIDTSKTYVPVGCEDWGKTPRILPIEDILGGNVNSIHKESDRYQLTSTSIDETFNSAFNDVPTNIESIQVYKYLDGYKYNFLLKNLTVTASKITATVEDVDPEYIFSDFSGIIFEYCLFERN